MNDDIKRATSHGLFRSFFERIRWTNVRFFFQYLGWFCGYGALVSLRTMDRSLLPDPAPYPTRLVAQSIASNLFLTTLLWFFLPWRPHRGHAAARIPQCHGCNDERGWKGSCQESRARWVPRVRLEILHAKPVAVACALVTG